jgi:hypothetical protein
MKIQELINKLNDGLFASLKNGSIHVESPDYDIDPCFSLTKDGLVVYVSAFGDVQEVVTVTWEQLSQIKAELNNS